MEDGGWLLHAKSLDSALSCMWRTLMHDGGEENFGVGYGKLAILMANSTEIAGGLGPHVCGNEDRRWLLAPFRCVPPCDASA